MKYDDAQTYSLNFETDLPIEAGGTHAGMYLAWAARKGLLSNRFDERALAPLQARTITGPQLYFSHCDGQLTDSDFSSVGNAFTGSYYEASFAADYTRLFIGQMTNGGQSTDDFCSVADTWENHDRLAPLLDQRFAQWQQPGRAAAAATQPAYPGPAAAPRPSPRPRPGAPAQPEGRVGGAAVIALLVGAAGFVLLLLALSVAHGAVLQAFAALLGAVAAFGTYRCSLGLGKSGAVSALLAVLAFVPLLGSLVCLSLLRQIYRQHRPR